jgi:hypothetical protein
MAIWDYPVRHIVNRLDCRQFEFLAVSACDAHLAILIELYRARQQETLHELSFDSLYERLQKIREQFWLGERFEPGDLRGYLDRLERWRNVAMRLEPRRVRQIADRGLKLLLVRLTESTNTLLEHLESQLEHLEHEVPSSARFSLLEVDDALEAIIGLLEADGPVAEDEHCRAGRELMRAKRAVEEAGNELLRLDLWLSETAVRPPDGARLAELLGHLETYFERYLQEVEERRERCHEKLSQLLTEAATPFLVAMQEATVREFAEDPTRAGRRPPELRPILYIIQDFLRPEGILDHRRMVVHQRLADVAGHLKRYLNELVRRSQLVAGLRRLSQSLFRAADERFENSEVSDLFARLWRSAHVVTDESGGVPCEKAVPQRPYVYRPSGIRRFAGASIRPSQNGRPKSDRPMIVQQMENLNEFVLRSVLRGDKEALVSEAVLEDVTQVRLLIAAIRMARAEKSRLRRRYLRYQVVKPTVVKQVAIATLDGSGRVHLPQLIFTVESTR